MQQPTTTQIEALRQFASAHGRTWKSALRQSWMNGVYPSGFDSGSLQQVRNQFGPTWLVNLSLERITEHAYSCGHRKIEVECPDRLKEETHNHPCDDCGGHL